jgi:hypothetical protein
LFEKIILVKPKILLTAFSSFFIIVCYSQQKGNLYINSGDPLISNPLKKASKEFAPKSALRIDSLYALYESVAISNSDSVNFLSQNSNLLSARMQVNLSLMKIPFSTSYNYQKTDGFAYPASIHLPQFVFDRQLFTRNISDRLRSSFDVNSLVAEKTAAINNLKEIAVKELKDELLKLVKNYDSAILDKVKSLNSWKDFFNGDVTYFTNKLVGEKALSDLRSSEKFLAQTQEKINSGQAVDSGLVNKAMGQVTKVKDMQKAVATIMKYKSKWDESGLVKLIKRMELDKDMQLQEMLSNPAVMMRLAKEKLSLNKLEKIFLSLKQFKAGASSSELSAMTMNQSLRSSGFDLESISKGNNSIGVTIGKLQEFLSVAERSVAQGNNMQSATQMAGVSFAKQGSDKQGDAFSKVSLFSYASSSAASAMNMLSPVSGSVARNFVFTISKKIGIGTKGSLLTEVSKSAGQEENISSAGKMFNTENFFTNLGLSMDYSNEFPGINLSHDLSFQYTGNGYMNQGNSYLLPGAKQLDNSVNKTFFNRKLSVVVRNKFRSFQLNAEGRRVQSLSNSFDVKWKFSKSNSVSLKYQPAYSASLNGAEMLNSVSTNRLAADLNIAARIKRIRVQNFATFSYLSTKTLFTGMTDELYKTIQLNSMHTIVSGDKQFFVNTGFSYALQNGSMPYLNSSLLIESGIVYDLFESIKLTSAFNYNAVKDWYSQMVFKQSIGGQLGKRLELNLNLDIAKNFKVMQPYPVQNLNSNISARYLIF